MTILSSLPVYEEIHLIQIMYNEPQVNPNYSDDEHYLHEDTIQVVMQP